MDSLRKVKIDKKGKKDPNDICMHALSVFAFCGWTAPLVLGRTFLVCERIVCLLFFVFLWWPREGYFSTLVADFGATRGA